MCQEYQYLQFQMLRIHACMIMMSVFVLAQGGAHRIRLVLLFHSNLKSRTRDRKKSARTHMCVVVSIFIAVYFREEILTLRLLHFGPCSIGLLFCCVRLCETSTKLKNQTFNSKAIQKRTHIEKGIE